METARYNRFYQRGLLLALNFSYFNVSRYTSNVFVNLINVDCMVLYFLLSRNAARALSEFLFAHYRPSITYKKFPERIHTLGASFFVRFIYPDFPDNRALSFKHNSSTNIGLDTNLFFLFLPRLYILIIKISINIS